MPIPALLEVERVAGRSAGARLALTNLLVVDERNAHLTAKARVEPGRNEPFTVGEPVRLHWGQAAERTVSYMYVHNVTAQSLTRGMLPGNDLTLVGASWPLKNGNVRVMRTTTAAGVLRTIAAAHGLRHEFLANERTFDTFISRDSDWLGLRDLAERVGAFLRVDAATVRLLDPNWTLGRLQHASLFRADDYTFDAVTPVDLRGDQRALSTYVLDPNMQVTRVHDGAEDLPLSANRPLAYRSPNEARRELLTKRRAEWFTEAAKVSRVAGTPAIRVGEPVGFVVPNAHYNGFWTVTKAVHHLHDTSYKMELEVGRGPDHPRSVRDLDRYTEFASAPVPHPRLLRDRWTA